MVVVLPSIIDTSSKDEISYSEFMAQVRDGDVESVKIDNTNGDITGELSSGAEFSTTGPLDGGIPDSDLTVLREQDVKVEYDTPQASFFASLRSEEHTSELQSLMRISYAVFCLKKKK